MWTFSGSLTSGGAARLAAGVVALLLLPQKFSVADAPFVVLDAEAANRYVETFNACDEEDVVNLVPNSGAFEWIARNAPLFDCPSARVQEIYYFRWWTFRKHIVQTPEGRVLTEFLTPVSHAGPYNTVSCAIGHHIAEGRWLRDQKLIDEYAGFWLHSGPNGVPAAHFHKFSSWMTAALYDRYCVTGDRDKLVTLLDDLVDDYQTWERERQLPGGMFWQHDVKDGMEESISGGRHAKNIRPTINSYMVGNARAIAAIARMAGKEELATQYEAKADRLARQVVDDLWDDEAEFFKVRLESGKLSDAREEIGYLPWIFGIAGPQHAVAWQQVTDPAGFWAPFGLTTAERRHPAFRSHGTGTCEWDGAVWPFATSQTLTGMAKLLRSDAHQTYVTKADYFDQLLRYAEAQQQDGIAYIGEYYDGVTGDWLITGPKARRSRYYNHSTFNDLAIGGLVGLVPQANDSLVVDPLLPENTWDWFCLDGVRYHGHNVTVIWDRTGRHYRRGAGLSIWIDGTKAADAENLSKITVNLPPSGDNKTGSKQ